MDPKRYNTWKCRNCDWTYDGKYPGKFVGAHETEFSHWVDCPPRPDCKCRGCRQADSATP